MVEIVDRQIALRAPMVNGMLKSLNDITVQQFQAGEMAAMEMFKRLPEIEASYIDSEIELLERSVYNET